MAVSRSVLNSRLKLGQLLVKDFNDGTLQGFVGGSNSENKLLVTDWDKSIFYKTFRDITLKCKVIVDSAGGVDGWRSVRIVQRYIDDDNHYFLSFQPNSTELQLVRRVGGVDGWYQVNTFVPVLGTEYDLEWTVAGVGASATHTVKINGVTYFNGFSDADNTILNSGSIGVKNSGATGRLDDIEVWETTIPTRSTASGRSAA